jgi:hypothetical protein
MVSGEDFSWCGASHVTCTAAKWHRNDDEETNLSFVLRQMSQAEAERVLHGEHADVLKRFSDTRLTGSLFVPGPWVINEARSAYLLKLRNREVREEERLYLFGLDGEIAVLYVPEAFTPRVSFRYLSDAMKTRLPEAKRLIAQGFQISGRWFTGPTDYDPMIVEFAETEGN